MRDWHIGWRSEEIYGTPAGLYVCDVPWWAYGISRLTEWIDTHIFRHRWCTSWEWTFCLGWDRDEDGYYNHSLGGFLFGTFQWLANTEHRHRKNELSVNLKKEWLQVNDQKEPFVDDV